MNGRPNGAIFAIRRRSPTSIDQPYISQSLSGRPLKRGLDSGIQICLVVPVPGSKLLARRTSAPGTCLLRVSLGVCLPGGHGNVQGRPRYGLRQCVIEVNAPRIYYIMCRNYMGLCLGYNRFSRVEFVWILALGSGRFFVSNNTPPSQLAQL
jgi:hypothetical protein